MKNTLNLNERIDSLVPEITESLSSLIKHRSVEALDDGSGYPYGKSVHECFVEALALSERLGFRIANIDDRVGYAEYGEGDEMVAVLGHLDVVPEGDGWIHPPYGGVVADGRVYGRGTVDDKGPVVAALYALKAIKDAELPLKRRVRIIFGLNEESGCACMKHYVESGNELPVMAFTPDGEYPIINGEKGIVHAVYKLALAPLGASYIKELSAGTAPNVVPDRAYAQVVCTDAQAAAAAPIDKVSYTPVPGGLNIEALGVNAHGSTPEKGENAIARLAKALVSLGLDGASGELARFIDSRIGTDTKGKGLGINRRDDISGDLSLNLGMAWTQDDDAFLAVDIRYPVTHDISDFIDVLRAAFAAAGFSEHSLTHSKGIYTPPESELIKKLQKVYEAQTGEKAELLSIGGGTYAKSMPNTVAFGPIFPGEPNVEHKPNEYIEIENLRRNARMIAAAICELAN